MTTGAGSGESKAEPPFTRPASHAPTPDYAAQLRAEVCAFSRTLLGIHEEPPHSNAGPAVHRIQSATGAYNAPWCVSTVQYEDLHVGLDAYADRTASAYFYAEYAREHGDVVAHPIAGAAVVYHIGAGHAGRIVRVYADGTFDAVEGNEGDAVRLVRRSPRSIACTYALRLEYRD